MSHPGKKRLPRGEARRIIHKWCDDFVEAHGARPTYTQAQQGSGIAEMTFQTPWAEWKAKYEERLPAPQAPNAVPLAQIAVPTVIHDAWISAVATLDAAKIKELEEEKLLVRRELDKVRAEHAALTTEMDAVLADGEAFQGEFEDERAEAAAALANAMGKIAERDAALAAIQAELVQVQKELAVEQTALKIAKETVENLSKSLDQAVRDERAAHLTCEKTHGELTEAQILTTRLRDELEAAKSALTAMDAAHLAKDETLKLIQEKLNIVQQDLSARMADLAGALATVTGLREQLSAAEARTEHARQRWETEATVMRERILDLERELAALRPAPL